MGVPGLWDILRPSGQVRSLTHLAVVDGFEANRKHRGLRIGIDASIWFFHAAYGKEGENPELRTLFFRCCRLMTTPFLPLFVFDGPKRPKVKRGKRVSGNAHWLTTGMKNIIEAFGFEWRTAPGEAEAELAYLSRIGVIDAILSDDVDNFLFGATMVIRNPSATLSGNKAHPVRNSAGRDDGNHSVVYTSSALLTHPDIGLTLGGLILIGLLSGGDYHQAGLARCGMQTAHALARCGFGDSLLEALLLPEDELDEFLKNWRQQIRNELKTNSKGYMARKNPSLAKAVPEDFPDIDILISYAQPITSESEGRRVMVDWTREPDLGKVAGLCELYFEWGVKDVIIKRFRTVLWPSAVLRILRRAVLNNDEEETGIPSTPRKKSKHATPIGTPSSMIAKHFSTMQLHSPTRNGSDSDEDDEERLIVKIHSERRHPSTDGVLEYRVEIAPAQLVRLSAAGVKGIRPPESLANSQYSDDDEENDEEGGSKKKRGVKKPPPDPDSHLRVWMPATMLQLAEPALVKEYEDVVEKKAAKKKSPIKAKGATKKKATGKKAKTTSPCQSDSDGTLHTKSKAKNNIALSKATSSKSSFTPYISESDTDDISNAKAKTKKIGGPNKTTPSLYEPNSDCDLIPDTTKAKARVISPSSMTATSIGLRQAFSLKNNPVRKEIDFIQHNDASDTDAPSKASSRWAASSKQRTLQGLLASGTSSSSSLNGSKSESRHRALQQLPPRLEEEEGSDDGTYDLGTSLKNRVASKAATRNMTHPAIDLMLTRRSTPVESSKRSRLPDMFLSSHADKGPSTAPSAANSSGSGLQRRAPRPFPLRLEEEESDGGTYSLIPPIKPSGILRTVNLSPHQPRKSPRKSVNSSPGGGHQIRRPVSPSPHGKVGTKLLNPTRPAPEKLDIIEVSSDSDGADSQPPLAPLLLARARQRPQPAVSKTALSMRPPPKSDTRSKQCMDVIDLT